MLGVAGYARTPLGHDSHQSPFLSLNVFFFFYFTLLYVGILEFEGKNINIPILWQIFNMKGEAELKVEL
jgi:hypothetical protein